MREHGRLGGRGKLLGCLLAGVATLVAVPIVCAQGNSGSEADSAAVVPSLPDSVASSQTPPDSGGTAVKHFEPVSDRWRDIEPPPYELNVRGNLYDPYNRNPLKGDYPIVGQNTFLVLTGSLTSLTKGIRSPTPAGVSTERPVSEPFFGRDERLALNQFVRLGLELYHGDVAFRPRDWELRVLVAASFNYLNVRENNLVNINVRRGSGRTDSHLGFQELSLEKHLFNVNDRFDFVSFRAGIQKFASDFRGFVFSDYNLGGRLLGNLASNRVQYNAAFFPMLEKDTNSGLNTVFDDRDQEVGVANVYFQDLFMPGYTAELSFHYNLDHDSIHFNDNGFPVRPAVIGRVAPHRVEAYYVGWTGDGHFGRLNLTHALYQVLGHDSMNPVADRRVTLNAQMAALEVSVDKDWMRFRASGFYSSGDSRPVDSSARGFDAIVDEPFFAGGPLSLWNQQAIGLLGVNLVNEGSLIPNLRSDKFEGQPNFVNPGIFIANAGYAADLTPKLTMGLNLNYLRFVTTESLESFLNQPQIDRSIGLDYGAGFTFRPFLNNNASISLVGTALSPLAGFDDIYETPATLYSVLSTLAVKF